jgi:hypothetical protein
MAQWAFVIYDVGGWVEGWRRIKERGWYPENFPEKYTGNGSGACGPEWDQDRFYQRGRGKPWFTFEEKHDVLWMIYQYVEYMLDQGVPRAEILSWDVGAQAWDAVHDALTTNGDDHAKH